MTLVICMCALVTGQNPPAMPIVAAKPSQPPQKPPTPVAPVGPMVSPQPPAPPVGPDGKSNLESGSVDVVTTPGSLTDTTVTLGITETDERKNFETRLRLRLQ